MHIDKSSNIFITGYTCGQFPEQTKEGTYADAFVIKYDNQGTQKWVKAYKRLKVIK